MRFRNDIGRDGIIDACLHLNRPYELNAEREKKMYGSDGELITSIKCPPQPAENGALVVYTGIDIHHGWLARSRPTCVALKLSLILCSGTVHVAWTKTSYWSPPVEVRW
jgi:hypothetical protein